MKRISLLLLITLMLTLNCVGQKLPNILWLTSEDHGPQMGCYEDANATTPNVDALAAKGMTFTKVWSCAPCCAPARTAIISGMYPGSVGGEHMRSMVAMPSGKKMYPQFLRDVGYYCGNNKKEDYNLRKPEGVWNDSSNEAHWRNRKDEQPFFVIFNSEKSHEFKLYKRPHEQLLDPSKVRVPAYNPDVPEIRRDWAQYYDIITDVDADAGERLEELEEDGLTEETIVFYYGDHGSGMPRCKRWPSNSGLHVPLVVYFPKKWRHLAPKEYQPGGKSDRMVNFVDLAPTLLSLAGIKPPDWMQGYAFAGQYQSEFQPLLFGGRGRMDEIPDLVRSVTDGRYVYLRNYMPHLSQAQHVGTQFLIPTTAVWYDMYQNGECNEAQSIFWRKPRYSEELYDLQNDPDEVNNLAGSPAHKEILEKLRAANHEHLLEIKDVSFLPEGEIHVRSAESSPYDMGHDELKYPFEHILYAAEVASDMKKESVPELYKFLKDEDNAVRYWGVLGFLIRGEEVTKNGIDQLRKRLNDNSPFVRIAAAECLAKYGSSEDNEKALDVLAELAPTDKNGIMVSMAALTAVGNVGKKAMPLKGLIENMNTVGFSPDERFNKYVPTRIIPRILEIFSKE
jgi:arylsulfatase A-like enzyme